MTTTKKSILAISLVAVMVLSVFCLAACNISLPVTDNAGGIMDSVPIVDNGEIAENNGIVFRNTKLMSLAYAAASETNSAGITLTATVGPETATDKTVDWSVAFINPSSSWASGKTASNYVSVTPTSDGATTATISALNGFAEQIVITVTSRSNTDVTATCTVDYGARLGDTATLTFTNSILAPNFNLSSSGIQTVESIRGGSWQGMVALYGNNTFSYEPQYNSTYTVAAANANTIITCKPTTEFYNSLTVQGIAKASNEWASLPSNSNAAIYESLCNVVLVSPHGASAQCLANIDLFNTAVSATNSSHDFEIKVSVTTDFETKDYIFQCKFNRSGAAFTATSLTMSSSNIVL